VKEDGENFLVVPSTDVEPFKGVLKNGVRRWSPYRSKLAALAKKTGGFDGLLPTNRALYLGAGNGYTVSFLADLCKECHIYAVECSHTSSRDLLKVARHRKNIHPLIANARMASSYMTTVPTPDWLFQDISQRDQVEIFLSHLPFLQSRSVAILILKVESLSKGHSINRALDAAADALSLHCVVKETVSLEPYEKMHGALICTR